MVFGGNFVDLIIIIMLLVFTFEAFGRPLITELIDLLSFLTAFFLSFRFYNYPAKFFEAQFSIPHGFSLVLGFIVAWFLTETIFYILARTLLPKLPNLKIASNQFLSIITAFFKNLIFVTLFLVFLATFPIQPVVKKAINNSKIGSFLVKNAYQLEAPIKQVFGGVSEDSLSFLTIKPKTNERVDLGFKTSEISIDENKEFAMIDLVNKERTSRGLNALAFDSLLRDTARFHSGDMFRRGYFSHYSPEGESVADRGKKYGVKYSVIGENLAYAPTLELAHKGLMNSEGHRANILSPEYNKIGIGVIDGKEYGLMFTQVFSD